MKAGGNEGTVRGQGGGRRFDIPEEDGTYLIESSDVTTQCWVVCHDIAHFLIVQLYLHPATQSFIHLGTY